MIGAVTFAMAAGLSGLMLVLLVQYALDEWRDYQERRTAQSWDRWRGPR